MASPEYILKQILNKVDRLQREFAELKDIVSADVRTADRLITVREACEYLGKKRSAVYKMIQDGELPARRDKGRHIRVSFNQVQKFIS